jgi:hypothetical protein
VQDIVIQALQSFTNDLIGALIDGWLVFLGAKYHCGNTEQLLTLAS